MIRRRRLVPVAGIAVALLASSCATQEEIRIESLDAGEFRLTVTVGPHAVCDGEAILQAREADGALELRARRAVKSCDDAGVFTDFELDFSAPVPGRTVKITQPEGVTHCPEAETLTVICE